MTNLLCIDGPWNADVSSNDSNRFQLVCHLLLGRRD